MKTFKRIFLLLNFLIIWEVLSLYILRMVIKLINCAECEHFKVMKYDDTRTCTKCMGTSTVGRLMDWRENRVYHAAEVPTPVYETALPILSLITQHMKNLT